MGMGDYYNVEMSGVDAEGYRDLVLLKVGYIHRQQ